MRPARVLAVFAARTPADAALCETLRLLVALLATGAELRLLVRGPEDLADRADRAGAGDLLAGLEAFGVVPEDLDAVPDPALARAVEDADHLVRLAPTERAGAPPVVVVGAANAAALRGPAGQVIREERGRASGSGA